MTTIHEEMIDYHQGNGFHVLGYFGRLHPQEVLRRAWADVAGRPPWSLSSNCQHSTRRWHGVPQISPQVRNGVGLALLALIIGGGAAGAARSL